MLARLSLGTIALCLGAGAAIADPLADCSRGRNADVRLRACSEVIEGTAYGSDEKALAYRNRGNARADAGAGCRPLPTSARPSGFAPTMPRAMPAGPARGWRCAISGAIADYSEALRLTPRHRLSSSAAAMRTS